MISLVISNSEQNCVVNHSCWRILYFSQRLLLPKYWIIKVYILVCSLKCFLKKVIMWFCRESNSEQLLILNFMLKIRSYSSGNRRNFGKMSGIFAPSSKEFLSFSKIWLYLTLKNAISCHLRQKIEKMAR